jgi:hypothetical protein
MTQRQDDPRCNHAMGPWELQALPPVYSLPMGIWQLVHITAVSLSSRRPAQIGRQIMAADMPCTGMVLCPEELFGSYKRVDVHHIRMVAKFTLCA